MVNDQRLAVAAPAIMQIRQANFKRLRNNPGFAEIGGTHFSVRPAFTDVVRKRAAKKIPGNNNGGHIHFSFDVGLAGMAIQGRK